MLTYLFNCKTFTFEVAKANPVNTVVLFIQSEHQFYKNFAARKVEYKQAPPVIKDSRPGFLAYIPYR